MSPGLTVFLPWNLRLFCDYVCRTLRHKFIERRSLIGRLSMCVVTCSSCDVTLHRATAVLDPGRYALRSLLAC